ncbi:MAG TPA: carbohydrate ABC transporter permease [Candidatus Limnocylindrales bacterium]|jgi:alpha-glucoside transport system permease protein
MTAVAQPREITAPRTTSRFSRGLGRVGVHAGVVILMAIWLIPTIGLLVNSFRPAQDVASSGWWNGLFPPYNLSLDNYAAVLSEQGIGDAFVNSLFITIPSVIIPILVAAFAAYAFSWMSFPGRNLLFVAVVGLLVVPLQTTFIPILRLYSGISVHFGPLNFDTLNGEFLAVWLAHTGYGLPFAIYLLRNYMGGLPREVFESAAIDGASPVVAFLRLALPMSVPAIAALVIFQFLFVWNDLLVALVYIGSTNAANSPLTISIANLVTSLGGNWQLLGAAAFLSMALPLAVFAALQRYFVRGITGGAVKG